MSSAISRVTLRPPSCSGAGRVETEARSTRPLVVHQLGRRYRRSAPWAVRGVSLSVSPGSITALVGPNGAGKSTIMRTALGFERPDEGTVAVFGHDPQQDRSAAVESIGYVPQIGSLYRRLSIEEHFVLADAARASFDAEYASARIRSLGLKLDYRVGELSGGEQAQVALAIALATRAPLLILDEPLANLDPLARREFLTVLMEEVRRGRRSALLSSHIVADVEHACTRLVVLGAGRLLLDADIAEVRGSYSIVPAYRAPNEGIVGRFAGPGGDPVVLVAGVEGDRLASLEEVVLGYLAGGRDVGREAA